MADDESTEPTEVRRRRFPDPLTGVVGLAALFAAAYILTDGELGFPMLEVRWVIAGGAIFVGALLLLSSLRGNRR